MLCPHGATSGETNGKLTNTQALKRKSKERGGGRSDGRQPVLDEMVKGGLSMEVTFESRSKLREALNQVTLLGKDVLNSGDSEYTCSDIN